MRQQVEQMAKEKAAQFAALLNGRYRKYISDAFLITFLTDTVVDEVMRHKQRHLENAAYTAGAYLFENLLEYGCGASGNGHHVAQNFASLFVDETIIITT